MQVMNQGWAGLPKHLLDLILGKSESFTDRLQFGAVCLPWHSIIKDNPAKQKKLLRHHQVPMLLFPCEEADTWTIYTVMNKKFLDLKLSLSYKENFSGSSEGWLVISNEDHTVTLYKPEFIAKNEENNQVSTTSIDLPYVSPPIEIEDIESWDPEDLEFLAELKDRIVAKALITADPLTNPDKCLIFVIYGGFSELACIRLNKDTTWIKFAEKSLEDIVHYNNKVYTVNFDGKLMSLDIAVAEPSPSAIKCVAPAFPFRAHTKRYLVESRGELFQVVRFFSDDDKIRSTRTFRVYMVDFEKEKWVEINNLGGAAFFVGDSTSTSVLASDFSGCQSNCIYFTHDDDSVGYAQGFDLGIYNVECGSFVLHYAIDPTSLSRIFDRPPIWVVPIPNV